MHYKKNKLNVKAVTLAAAIVMAAVPESACFLPAQGYAAAAEGATSGSTETASEKEPAETVAGALREQEAAVSDDAVIQIRIGYEFDDISLAY